MDFELTDIQKSLKKVARDFALKEFPPIARECDIKEEFPEQIWKKSSELGFAGAHFPEEYNGANLGFLDEAIIMEELCRVDPGLGLTPFVVGFGSDVVLYHGTEEQKRKYLPGIPKGGSISFLGSTEPGAGSDVAGIKTKAVKDGGEWVINGQKMFITNGTIADWGIILAVTDPDEPKRHRRLSTFIVETKAEGFEATKIEGKMGLRASDTAEIAMDDVRVPEENLVGERGRGFYYIMEFFDMTRIIVAAQAVGVAQGALDMAVKYAKDRETFGQPLASYQGIQFELAEMQTRVEAARNMLYKAAWGVDNGKQNIMAVAAVKWFAAEAAVKNCDRSLQIHGGYGYINDMDIERFYRAAKLLEIYEGTKEIEKLIIARELLK